MKYFLLINLIVLVSFSGCKKSPVTIPEDKSFPFENTEISMQVASATMPPFTKFIHFFNENTGIAITNGSNTKSMIFKTTDNGITWSLKYTHPVIEQPLREVIFTDQNTGYAIGGNSGCGGTGCTPPGAVLLKTNDGGETWNIIYQAAGGADFVSIDVNTTGNLFLLKNGGGITENPMSTLLKSTDGGASWTVNSTFNYYLNKIVFNKNSGYLTGKNINAIIIRSTDDGDTWSDTKTFIENMIVDISFAENTGYCILDNYTVYKTIDQGDNWVNNYYSTENISTKINTLSDKTCLMWGISSNSGGGCFGAPDGAFKQTSNSGSTWSGNLLKEISNVCTTSFYSSTEGYILSGKLIKVKTKTQ